MSQEIIKVGAILDGVKTLSDGTLKVSFALSEIPTECAASIIKLHRSFGWLLFSPSQELEAPSEPPAEFRNDRSPSQRLRAVIYVWHQQSKSDIPFEQFYCDKIETVIQWIKDKLEPVA